MRRIASTVATFCSSLWLIQCDMDRASNTFESMIVVDPSWIVGVEGTELNTIKIIDEKLYALTNRGLYESPLDTSTPVWRSLGLKDTEVFSFIIGPDGRYYAGGFHRGHELGHVQITDPTDPDNLMENHSIFRSSDRGHTWEPIDEGFSLFCPDESNPTSDCIRMRAQTIVITPQEPYTIFVSSIGKYVYRAPLDLSRPFEPIAGNAMNCSTSFMIMKWGKLYHGGECPLDEAFLSEYTFSDQDYVNGTPVEKVVMDRSHVNPIANNRINSFLSSGDDLYVGTERSVFKVDAGGQVQELFDGVIPNENVGVYVVGLRKDSSGKIVALGMDRTHRQRATLLHQSPEGPWRVVLKIPDYMPGYESENDLALHNNTFYIPATDKNDLEKWRVFLYQLPERLRQVSTSNRTASEGLRTDIYQCWNAVRWGFDYAIYSKFHRIDETESGYEMTFREYWRSVFAYFPKDMCNVSYFNDRVVRVRCEPEGRLFEQRTPMRPGAEPGPITEVRADTVRFDYYSGEGEFSHIYTWGTLPEYDAYQNGNEAMISMDIWSCTEDATLPDGVEGVSFRPITTDGFPPSLRDRLEE